MCLASKPKAPPPPPPMPKVEQPTAEEIKAATPTIVKKSSGTNIPRKRGKRSLRTDVGYGGGSSGVNVP